MGIRERIVGHRHYERAVRWSRMTLLTASAQGLVQMLALVCGLLVIRLLPVREYAFYTIANTALGMITMLSDGGISSGVMAAGGKVWRDRDDLGRVMATGVALCRKFAGWAMLVAVPLLAALLLRNGAGALSTLLVVASIIPAALSSVRDTILQTVPKLHSLVRPMQRNQMETAAVRLALTALFAFLFPWAWVAILASGAARIVGNVRLRGICRPWADPHAPSDPRQRERILSTVRYLMPQAIYYSLSAQLTVWLLSAWGTTTAVAGLGALGRVAVASNLFSSPFVTLAYPSFARCDMGRGALLRRLLPVLAAAALTGLALLGLTALFSTPILRVLGPQYGELRAQLLLAMTASGIGLLSGVAGGMMASRGWPVNPVMLIGLNLAAIVAGICLFDVGELSGVLKFNILLSVSLLISNLTNVAVRFGRRQTFRV